MICTTSPPLTHLGKRRAIHTVAKIHEGSRNALSCPVFPRLSPSFAPAGSFPRPRIRPRRQSRPPCTALPLPHCCNASARVAVGTAKANKPADQRHRAGQKRTKAAGGARPDAPLPRTGEANEEVAFRFRRRHGVVLFVS
ncbi:hypothetical protein BS78_01G371100 [Paspalum vaginatum]|nr:hypothetical protein BS78_01G371100 [Paspalum vaginatum]